MLFSKRKTDPSFNVEPVIERVSSVIGPGINWRGDLRGRGGIRIEGTFEGELAIDGLVVVGESGKVTCELLKAEALIVAGQVRGNIQTKRLEIRATGRIWGDVVTESFSSEDGAFLRGQMRMEEKLDLDLSPPPSEPAAAVAADDKPASEDAQAATQTTMPVIVHDEEPDQEDESGKIPSPWAK